MVIGLLVETGDDSYDIGITSSATFDKEWRPVCDALGLSWMPLFRSPGISLESKDIPSVLDEINRMIMFIEGNSSSVSTGYQEIFLTQLNMLKDNLNDLLTKSVEGIFIG